MRDGIFCIGRFQIHPVLPFQKGGTCKHDSTGNIVDGNLLAYLVINPDFAFKRRKNLICSNPPFRSLCGMLIISVLKAARWRI
jgi:hypothetical protein